MDSTLKGVADFFSGKPNNAKFFNASTNKRGEIYELKQELNADTRPVRKDAVKRVIASMTVGKDVSVLFADVVKNMQTDDLELKKLVYLYLANYAKTQPELVILAVNTFVKDCEDINPLVRALAIRTMGCLRVHKITDYLCEPLKKALHDDHPYVRKTAAICVTKLHDLDAQLCRDGGFIIALQEMLSDTNPMVIANAVASLVEIHNNSKSSDVFQINVQLLNKLLTALNECTEWGQIYILEALSYYVPSSSQEAESVVDRVMPRLQHVNSCVVLNAVKVLVIYLEYIKNDEISKTLIRKLSPPLVTLLSSPAEVQYVALRNIDLIVQRRPEVLQNDVSVFFCKYNDLPFVKLEKLEIIMRLVSATNLEVVISELKEYASEVDVDFVRKSIQAIGRCAIKIEQGAEKCVAVLGDLIKTKINYVVQEAICVIKDIFRKYPQRYESIIPLMCENLESLDEPEAKSAIIWIVGEYAHKIENAGQLMQHFCESFKLEVSSVQTQLVAAVVKLFLKRPSAEHQSMVQRILQLATTTAESADLRDKAFIYWRLLSADPRIAKGVVLSERPPINSESSAQLSPTLLMELVMVLSSVASVYQKPASTFLQGVSVGAGPPVVAEAHEEDEDHGDVVQTGTADLLDLDFSVGGETVVQQPTMPNMSAMNSQQQPQGKVDNLLDLLG